MKINYCLVPPGSTCSPRSEKDEATREARGTQQINYGFTFFENILVTYYMCMSCVLSSIFLALKVKSARSRSFAFTNTFKN